MNFRPIALLLIVVGALLTIESLLNMGATGYAHRQNPSGQMGQQDIPVPFQADNSPVILKIGGAVLVLGIVLRLLSRRPRY